MPACPARGLHARDESRGFAFGGWGVGRKSLPHKPAERGSPEGLPFGASLGRREAQPSGQERAEGSHVVPVAVPPHAKERAARLRQGQKFLPPVTREAWAIGGQSSSGIIMVMAGRRWQST